MNHLDNLFNYFATTPLPPGDVWKMDATLTGTEQVSTLPAGIFTASGVIAHYAPSPPPAKIRFDVKRYCKTPPPGAGPPPSFSVTLTQTVPPPGSVYKMGITFPGGFTCDARVDAASQVVYGSQLAQFVTLVLIPGTGQG